MSDTRPQSRISSTNRQVFHKVQYVYVKKKRGGKKWHLVEPTFDPHSTWFDGLPDLKSARHVTTLCLEFRLSRFHYQMLHGDLSVMFHLFQCIFSFLFKLKIIIYKQHWMHFLYNNWISKFFLEFQFKNADSAVYYIIRQLSCFILMDRLDFSKLVLPLNKERTNMDVTSTASTSAVCVQYTTHI